jgi:hypothetical protein
MSVEVKNLSIKVNIGSNASPGTSTAKKKWANEEVMEAVRKAAKAQKER